MKSQGHRRGKYRREDCVFIGAWIPVPLMDLVDRHIADADLDRSKIVRRALEEKLNIIKVSA